jgi:hypothetical protein
MTPTWLYLAGVPGAAKPVIHVTPTGLAGDVDDELPQLDASAATLATASSISGVSFSRLADNVRQATTFARSSSKLTSSLMLDRASFVGDGP